MTPLEAWLSTPLILIGPGTGIAPMRSLLQARRRAAARMKSSGGNNATAANANANAAVSVSVAPCLLYFGCRSPAADWYYRSEFEAMVEDGTLLRYRTAFSKEEIEEEEEEGKDDGQKKKKKEKKLKPKRYVTHLLREDADELWRLLSPPSGSHQFPAAVVVAGSAKNMPRDVQQCFEQDVAAERGGLGAEGGKAFVRRMVSSGRYCVEAWS